MADRYSVPVSAPWRFREVDRGLPEDGEDFLEAGPSWIKHDAGNLGMTGISRADLLIRRVLVAPPM